MEADGFAYGDSAQKIAAKPAVRERAQTANKTGKPPLASNTALHNLGSAREKTNDDSLTTDIANKQIFMEAEQLKVQLKKQ